MRLRRTAGQGLSSAIALWLFAAASGLLTALPTGSVPRSVPPDTATVVVVYDGDTVKVKFKDGAERRVRLIGIDSPELGDERESVRFMAHVAKRFAFLKLYRREVGLSYDWQLEDKYGRLLAFLTTGDGALFNELILREGFAFKLLAFPFKPELMKRFEAAESEARRGEKGLWQRGDPAPVAPAEAARLLGQLVSVTMVCDSVEKRKPFIVLRPAGGEIEVLVPERRLADFPGLEALAGKLIVVRGLVEEFRGRIQIMADLPMQIRIHSSSRGIDRARRPGL